MAEDMDSLRQELLADLPGRIRIALSRYRDFAETVPPDEAKSFTAYHAACKAALAHVETLVKLARWAEGKADPQDENSGRLDRLLAEARSALDGLDDAEEDDDA